MLEIMIDCFELIHENLHQLEKEEHQKVMTVVIELIKQIVHFSQLILKLEKFIPLTFHIQFLKSKAIRFLSCSLWEKLYSSENSDKYDIEGNFYLSQLEKVFGVFFNKNIHLNQLHSHETKITD